MNGKLLVMLLLHTPCIWFYPEGRVDLNENQDQKVDRSGIRTHAHIRVPEVLFEEFLESGALDRSAILPASRSIAVHINEWKASGNFAIAYSMYLVLPRR